MAGSRKRQRSQIIHPRDSRRKASRRVVFSEEGLGDCAGRAGWFAGYAFGTETETKAQAYAAETPDIVGVGTLRRHRFGNCINVEIEIGAEAAASFAAAHEVAENACMRDWKQRSRT